MLKITNLRNDGIKLYMDVLVEGNRNKIFVVGAALFALAVAVFSKTIFVMPDNFFIVHICTFYRKLVSKSAISRVA